MAALSASRKKLAKIALQQYDRYHLVRENQEPLASQVRAYWAALGIPFPGYDTAWSAVFVSWCVKTAGATAAQFSFSQRHSQFVYRAIQNAIGGTGIFFGREIGAYAPDVGDLLHNNRKGNSFDFAYAKTHQKYESHSAIVVEVGSDVAGRYLRTIGGNEGDSVGLKEVRLDARGLVKNSDGLYISIVECGL